MNRVLDRFNGWSKKKRVLVVSAVPFLVLVGLIEWWTTPTSGHVLAEDRVGSFHLNRTIGDGRDLELAELEAVVGRRGRSDLRRCRHRRARPRAARQTGGGAGHARHESAPR